MTKALFTPLLLAGLALSLAACERAKLPVEAGTGPKPELPPPNQTWIPTVNIAPAKGWDQGAMPTAAAGLAVAEFADQLDHPRWLHVLPNGDVLVAETQAPPAANEDSGIKGWIMGLVMKRAGSGGPSANRITLLRDQNGDGTVDQRAVFLEGLHSPFGMALVGSDFYVANTDAVVRYDYQPDATRLVGPGEKVVDLPAGTINYHWTKNLIASPDGSRLYVSVGSNSNVGENGLTAEDGRAAIWEINIKDRSHRVFASGLRNPVGMAWQADTGALWAAVNERDEIGSDLVPDYMTSVQDGGFYGWPYSYYGDHVDVRVEPPRPDLVAKAIAPDYALGPHTASLGLADAGGNRLGGAFAAGMFVGQHGSWNRKPPSGYKVVFVPFANGEPSGQPIDVLTGFLNGDGDANGRPVGVAIDRQGALLVADDVGNRIWRVTGGEQPGVPQAQAKRD